MFATRLLSAVILGAVVSTTASATFLPENEIHAQPRSMKAAQISEAQFNEAIGAIQKNYEPVVKALGGRLAISGSWGSDQLNAGATRMFGSWKVKISGAIARQPALTPDGLTLIVCHELGHHLGGYAFAEASMPLQGTWAANEGQADYFSTQACARKLWAPEKERNAEHRMTVGAFVKLACDTAWTSEDDQNLCYRINAAVKAMTDTMGAILARPAPQFETPVTTAVAQTSDAHPAIQCRMDTAFQGSLCTVKFSETVIPGNSVNGGRFSANAEAEAAKYSCMATTHAFGFRPACWFKQRL